MDVYAEYGALGVLVSLFVYGYFKQGKRADEQAVAIEDLKIENKGQSESIDNIEKMVIKLIDRWNKSDSEAQRRHENMLENAERRQEKLTFELRTHSESLNYLKGKLDQK